MRTSANGIEIEYETFGNSGDDPLLLVMGLGGQLTLWDEAFCKMLAGRGFYAIRYDNRDVGLSTHFDEAGVPDMMKLMMATAQGEAADTAYTLEDMADDAAGLLDALSIERAHVVGASMGGMIAQTVAIRHAPRVKSLVSVMSTTGGPDAKPAEPEVMAALMKPAAADRDAQIEQSIELNNTIASPGFPRDMQRIRERIARDYDRAFHPVGTQRQMAAIVAAASRLDGLGRLTMPSLVIHGDADVLVPPINGQQTADAIPGSELLTIEGMGHDMPPGIFERLTEAITKNAAKAAGVA